MPESTRPATPAGRTSFPSSHFSYPVSSASTLGSRESDEEKSRRTTRTCQTGAGVTPPLPLWLALFQKCLHALASLAVHQAGEERVYFFCTGFVPAPQQSLYLRYCRG